MAVKTKRLTVSIDDRDYEALDAIARRSDLSLSWVGGRTRALSA